MAAPRPSVGLLVNPSTPEVMAEADALVDHFSVIPSRLLYDFGPAPSGGPRFRHPHSWQQKLLEMAQGRPVNAHSFGLSLPSAAPLDADLVEAVAIAGDGLGGYAWFSEHLNGMRPGRGGEAHSDAALALPVSYDQEVLDLLVPKLAQLKSRMGCPLLLENPATMTPLIEMEMEEPEFLNKLYHSDACSVLLDLHNLLVSERNGGLDCQSYLERLDPEAVVEVHLAGGEELHGFYTDSHSTLTPLEVWQLAYDFLPSCPNLRAITFEYNESYFHDFGSAGVRAELERMHGLAEACGRARLAALQPEPALALACPTPREGGRHAA